MHLPDWVTAQMTDVCWSGKHTHAYSETLPIWRMKKKGRNGNSNKSTLMAGHRSGRNINTHTHTHAHTHTQTLYTILNRILYLGGNYTARCIGQKSGGGQPIGECIQHRWVYVYPHKACGSMLILYKGKDSYFSIGIIYTKLLLYSRMCSSKPGFLGTPERSMQRKGQMQLLYSPTERK